MIRTDDHRPSVIDATAYHFMDAVDCWDEERKDYSHEFIKWERETYRPNAETSRAATKCDICGSRMRYIAVFLYAPTGKWITIGQDCAEKMEIAAEAAGKIRFLQVQSTNRREQLRIEAERAEKRAAFLAQGEENARLLAFLDEWQEFDRMCSLCKTEEEHAERNAEALEDAEFAAANHNADVDPRQIPVSTCTGYYRLDYVRENGLPARGSQRQHRLYRVLSDWAGRFTDDMVRAFNRYGYLTPKQSATLAKIVDQADERAAKRAREQSEASPVPVTDKRIKIAGTVLKAEWRDNNYGYGRGGSVKITVKDDRGFMVWGTCPSALSVDKGDRLEFTAAVEVSEDDPCFGYFKRPTKAAMLPAADVDQAAPEAPAETAPAVESEPETAPADVDQAAPEAPAVEAPAAPPVPAQRRAPRPAVLVAIAPRPDVASMTTEALEEESGVLDCEGDRFAPSVAARLAQVRAEIDVRWAAELAEMIAATLASLPDAELWERLEAAPDDSALWAEAERRTLTTS
ncbi:MULTISPECIES: hypothetical protein [Streptosporangium]|uniref:Uncharacterized protein n=1 Tax=Streptosporangium brasiliense TaxID=47480 RepID=A0ABT9RQ15_9ACTN|nr:hypothetical protein [Streptosporangium brasiliense]MDP9870380.1 hypothetical protein [Streptosporangium brasiliense]